MKEIKELGTICDSCINLVKLKYSKGCMECIKWICSKSNVELYYNSDFFSYEDVDFAIITKIEECNKYSSL